ncbi:MAG: hypothetical protein GKS01_10750 [Alphaproteobacteria bacterium]|nr:hypothetical protein [Alphaproteobacteria bacterium]
MTQSKTSFLAIATAAFITSGAPVGANNQTVTCDTGGFNALLGEITRAKDSKANPRLVASAQSRYELAMKLRVQKNMTACTQQLNAGMAAISKAKK